MALILRLTDPYIRLTDPYVKVQSTKFLKESGLILSKRSARILTWEKHGLWFAQITFCQSVLNDRTIWKDQRAALSLVVYLRCGRNPTTSPETSSKHRRKASEYKTSREVYRITVIRNKTRRKTNIRHIIHACLQFFIDKVLKEMQPVKSVVTMVEDNNDLMQLEDTVSQTYIKIVITKLKVTKIYAQRADANKMLDICYKFPILQLFQAFQDH